MGTVSRFIGLDVHKKTVVIAVADGSGGEPHVLGTVANTAGAVLKQLDKLGDRDRLSVCYEAGPTGYGLFRELNAAGILCSVIAPSKVPKESGDRVKTDKRDAVRLARFLRSGDLTLVTVPDERQEGIRDLSRLREDAKEAEGVARHQLSKFMLRHGRTFTGKTAWTLAHHAWLRAEAFEDPAQAWVRDEYVTTVERATERVAEIDRALVRLSEGWDQAPLVKALQALRGVRHVTAIGVAAELGDLTRFATAGQLMAFIGLVPTEHSSGDRTRRGGISKTGNGHVRRLLTESAWAYRFSPRESKAIKERLLGVSAEVRAIAWKAQHRLHTKYKGLLNRGKEHAKTITAVARELAGFIWSIGQQSKLLAA